MTAPDKIPAAVRQLQSQVSNPDVSAWVAANAGSGKTHVLVQRVINLLLKGVEPEKILCVTFTKAAAANMSKRVFDTLAAWTILDDAALDAEIRSRSNMTTDARRRAQARRLFARALETPGGLKVQTIHAFCTQLLHQFPFEANVAARFSVLDDTERTQILERLTLGVLLEGADEPDSTVGRALTTAMTAAADQTFREVMRNAIDQRDSIKRWLEGGVDAAIAALSKELGVEPADSQESIAAEFFSDSLIAAAEWPAFAKTLSRGAKTDCDKGRCFGALASLSDAERLDRYLEIFCTQELTPRKSMATKSIKDAGLIERLVAEQGRICALLERRRAVLCRDRSAALLIVTSEVLERYKDDKERRGLLDYDDLIDKALDLLRNVDAAWVHYKLDLGIDHLLIDEAQDTSKKQWEIVRRLVDEFTAGAGVRTVKRTIFAVGDEKQSIYSFQNAAPAEFASMRRHFGRAHSDSNQQFVSQQLEHSFRSGQNMLDAVDTVFKDIAASVTSDSDGFPPHIALPDAPPSIVEIWEPEKPDKRREIEGWDAPFDTVTETNPRVKLARRIARTVRGLFDDRVPVGADRRAARYGDFLILVRQRGPLFEAIIRALKNENIVVAGADRMVLTEHIAVMDLMALGDALLLPEDDLALATVLRGPLFGFEDEDLFEVAWNRGRLSLRAALARKPGEKFADASMRLDQLAQAAQRETPFGFFAQILGAGGGRRRFLARLGLEANDALDEFLNAALDYERREASSLQGFLAWLRLANAEVKRDMEIARDEVRVMTVHGAKGLEAPIVILADTMTQPAGPPHQRLLALPGGSMIWAGRKADDASAAAKARQSARTEAENEYRRLLYVAMTRAADRLIVCGAEGATKRPENCWYDLVRGPLDPCLVAEMDYGEKVFRYRTTPASDQPEPASGAEPPARPDRPALPSWLWQAAARAAPRAAPLSPSSAFGEEIARTVDGGNTNGAAIASSPQDRQKALERGRLIHRLMQSLPDIPPERRKVAAESYLHNAAAGILAAERSAIASHVLAIIADPRFAHIFAPGSRAEVSIVGRIPRDGADAIEVAGQVDRLVVGTDDILIADYKSDRTAPRRHDDVLPPYIAQLALYRAVLARIYPGKTVRAALIYTEGPVLVEIPDAAMDAALAAVLADRPAVTPQ